MADPRSESSRWAASPLADLAWRSWGDDYVAFESRSGQLVELSVLGAATMACLEERPGTIAELAEALAADLGQAVDAEFLAAVEQTVLQFRRLGWVEAIIHR
ncbi:MAG: HPr-rel-A system PqqD family peptide chaperone [Burkholderiales bacterium]|nr:HPr-rel-A system PqqD family peptide chaperone [Burkholderiales bacterium]